MTSYKKGILDLFDETTSDTLQLFSKQINNSDADVFIVMAHKAICLFKVLQDQNYINIGNKTVISNLSLDFETESLKNKKVAIVDDIMISGTAVSSAVNKAILCGANENNISVIVLAVDTNYMRMQFTNKLHKNILICDKYLDDKNCIKLSSNLSNAFSYYGIPYDYDFPIYEGIKININHNALFNNLFWTLFDISNDYQKAGEIDSYLVIPKKIFLNKFYKSIGVNFINSVNFKIKIHIKNYTNGNQECIITSLCLFNEIKKSDIETLFDAFIPDSKNNNYSIKAKTRYIQYFLSHRLFLYFSETASLTCNEIILPSDVNILFGYTFGNKIYNKLLDSSNIYTNKEIVIKCKNIDLNIFDDYKCFVKESKNAEESKVPNDIPPLLKPFIWWYDYKEIPVRNYLKENPVNFLDDYETVINKKMPRLNSGFSFNTLLKILNISSEDDKNALSIFIDRSIELGILVPTIYYNEEKQTICRAYRHGEDLPFALADQIRLLKFLLALENKINDINYPWDIDKTNGGIAQVSFEKMIVAFYQIGLKQGNIFNRFLAFDNIDIMKPFLSVHGRVNGFVNTKEIKEKNIDEHFYSEKIQIEDENSDVNKYEEYKYIKWLSAWLADEDNKFIHKKVKSDKFNKENYFIDKIRIEEFIKKQFRANIDDDICKKIKDIGETISKWYNYTLLHGGKDKFKEDATALTSCENINVFSSAIATEIHYFKNYWNMQAKTAFDSEDLSGNNFVWSVTEQALNSGREKKVWYDTKKAQEVINTISDKIFEDSPYNWDEYWNIENEPYPEGLKITEKSHEAIGYLYFYSACYDCLKSDGFWAESKLPDTLQEYERIYKNQCKKVENLEDNLFDIFYETQKIIDTNKKRNEMRTKISKVIPCSEKTVDEIEECIKKSESNYTVKYRSSLIFEVHPICVEDCDENIMNAWDKLNEDAAKTQLNIIRFSDECSNDNYIKYGVFFGIIRNKTYSIEYNVDILIKFFENLCEEFNCKAYSIKSILIPQIPAKLIFEHNTYKNINTYSNEFYRNGVSALENMFINNTYHQLILLTTGYTPINTKEAVEQLGWDTVNDIGPQSFTFFTGDTCITKYSNEFFQLIENPEMKISNSVVKIKSGDSIGAGLLVKTDNQVVCVTCNHIVSNYPNDRITATMIAANNIIFDLKPIKEILPNIENPTAEYEVAILEPQWNGKIPINIDLLISLDNFYDTSNNTCDCCGFPNSEFRWESDIKISRLLADGYKQLNNVDNIEEGFSGGSIVDLENRFIGIHEGRFNDMHNGKMIPSSIIKKEILRILGDYDCYEK